MTIAIVGAGLTGLTAAYRLSRNGHRVTVYEKEASLGGLAGTFRHSGWDWSIEQHYHHWFTNDTAILSLVRELGLSSALIIKQAPTNIWYGGKSIGLNTPGDVLRFSPLSLVERIRFGCATLGLKLFPPAMSSILERYRAIDFLPVWYGNRAYSLVWEPLITGKFGPFARTVNMAWFWARIKKRTSNLMYMTGGFDRLIHALADRIRFQSGVIRLNTPFSPNRHRADRTIITTPSSVFTSLYSLPDDDRKRLLTIPHLSALNLVIESSQPILPYEYWLNINDRTFPFIAVVQQTNLVSSRHYNGHHLTYVGNYLPPDHPYLTMTKSQLLRLYTPYLKRINPSFLSKFRILHSYLFTAPYAQPVFGIRYSRFIPKMKTPIPDVFLANMDMVYPWDRGTNYAVALGESVAKKAELP